MGLNCENINYYIEQSEIAAKVLSERAGFTIESISIQIALSKLLDIDAMISHEVLPEKRLSSDEIVGLLSEYNFRSVQPEVIASIELDESILPDGVKRVLTEARVKHKEIWELHKSDPDMFAVHAHNVESGIKLDLSDGLLYNAHNTHINKTIKCKELHLIRKLFTGKGVEMPPLADRCR